MKESILLSLLLLSSWQGTTMAQTDSEFNVRALAKDLEKRFEGCPRREVVSKFDRKHHKQVWQKQAWGPPTDVLADVKPNDSILYPYIFTVEFSLGHTFGPERQTKADAEGDSDLSQPEAPLAALLTGKYRNVYFASKDGIRLKTTEVLHRKLDGTSSTWEDRPLWPNACWDQIAAK